MRLSKDPKWLRYEMVRYAREHGVKPAARAFNTTPKTVRKWLSRWEPGSLRGLEDRRQGPNNRRSRIDPEQRAKAIGLKRKLKSWGAERIRRQFGLTISEKAIRKIWKQEGLLRKKRRKHKTKNDLREMKARWRLFEQIEIDTKHLYDIPEYFIQMKRHNLPKYQYTARDVVSGLQFLGYASECSLTYATLFAETIIDHLKACGVNLDGSRIQTDNGNEFVGAWSAKEPSLFTKTVQAEKGLIHHTIPPAAHTYQADVETVHRIIEDEFLEVEEFRSTQNFIDKATAYVIWFNVARTNSYKGHKTPWNIIQERNKNIPPNIAILPALQLDTIFRLQLLKPNRRGYLMVQYPCFSPTNTPALHHRSDHTGRLVSEED
ncbi:MAG: helix-turn-helix domain-containing protein [Candidatus Zixiibacteriota bacterium]